jgi:hypothetical protein
LTVKTFRFLFFNALMLLLTSMGPAAPAVGADPATPAGDVWLISTRGLPYPCSQHGVSQQVGFQRLDESCFVAATREEFLATLDPSQTTCFFVHGNRIAPSDAYALGLSFRRKIGTGAVPFRFVIWSWPSERIPGPLRDARTKASRADGEAYYLGSVLAELPSNARVSLIGYSFGARTVTGSLHLLAGGMVQGNSLGTAADSMVHPRAVLIAAAMPRVWLLPGGAHGLAPLQAEQLLLFYNPRDPALKHFPLVASPGHPTALGFEGVSSRLLGPAGSLLRQYNVAGSVGRSHSLSNYLDSAGIMATIGRFSLEAIPDRRS